MVASYELSLLIAISIKAHMIEERTLKLYLLSAMNIVLLEATGHIENSLPGNTVKRDIDGLAGYMKTQVL